MSTRLVRTTALGGSPLAAAMMAGSVDDSWHRTLRGVDAWRASALQVRERFAGGRWLEVLHDAIRPEGAAARRLERVHREGGVLVMTGQQPGLFGGPLYTWNKAISALALADALERQTGIPSAPLFWAATDDSDFEEARGTLLAVEGGTRALSLELAPPAGTPMSEAPLGDVEPLLRELEAAAGGAAFAPALAAARKAYTAAGATVGTAYVGLLRELLEPLGIAVLDATHESVRGAAGALLREAHARAPELDAALSARDAAIRAAGFTPQVEHLPGMSLVFATEGGIRRRLAVGEQVAGADAGALGPNVLLRPVVERALLPTVAYAAGPGELAYFAQVSAVADALGCERPYPVPRWSGMIVEPRVQRALDRIGMQPDDLRDPQRAAGVLAARHLPEAVSHAIAAVQGRLDAALREVRSADAGQLVHEAVLEGVSRSMGHRVERLRRRYLAAVKRREEAVMRDLATVQGALYPAGTAQERAVNLLPMLARCGVPLLDAMREEALAHATRLIEGGAAR